ncbi:RAMP superfamily CRISPR-associated protein [Geobacillus thermodenitrificans]|uniref:RAMP superfamily CRISPR-associated protein n=1 Tax=Geobacillus thermodenitrificans TaxID=33940 RepID=UPI002E247132|nr:type III-B CRISPR module RAMP protein Cmr1 [Geobacillus thermodenitrificans]
MERYESAKATAVVESPYQLVLLTPAAIHGAEPRTKAEFRLSSLRGVWRYFWRTLQDQKNAASLLCEEEKMFGGTRMIKQQSPVHLFMSAIVQGTKKENILPHKPSSFAVPVLPGGKEVTVTISMRKQYESRLKTYEWYFQYMLHLAGFGQRSRRGFGAMQWTGHQWENVEQYADSLRTVLENIGAAATFSFSKRGRIVARNEAVQTPHPVLSAVWVGEGKDSAIEVLKGFGRASHEANRYGTLGFVQGKNKLASPLWCTVRKIGGRYYPIITEVRTNEQRYSEPRYEQDRNRFLEIVGVRI